MLLLIIGKKKTLFFMKILFQSLFYILLSVGLALCGLVCKFKGAIITYLSSNEMMTWIFKAFGIWLLYIVRKFVWGFNGCNPSTIAY